MMVRQEINREAPSFFDIHPSPSKIGTSVLHTCNTGLIQAIHSITMGVVRKNKEAYFQKLKMLLETYREL